MLPTPAAGRDDASKCTKALAGALGGVAAPGCFKARVADVTNGLVVDAPVRGPLAATRSACRPPADEAARRSRRPRSRRSCRGRAGCPRGAGRRTGPRSASTMSPAVPSTCAASDDNRPGQQREAARRRAPAPATPSLKVTVNADQLRHDRGVDVPGGPSERLTGPAGPPSLRRCSN